MYSRVTDAIYQALWGMDAKQLEARLGCGRHESRNRLDANSLRVLERAEARVMDFIDEDNWKPIEAAAMAQVRPARFSPI